MVEFKKLKWLKKATMLLPFVSSLLFVSTTLGQSVIEECMSFTIARDYQRAIEAGQRAVKMFPNNVYANLCLGGAYALVEEFNLAVNYLRRAVSLTSDEGELSEIYNILGDVLQSMGDYDSALYYYSRQLAIGSKREDKKSQALALSNIASVYGKRGEYDKAFKYYSLALNLAKDDGTKATIYDKMASTYIAKGDYKKAIKYLQKVIKMRERAGDYRGVAEKYIILGFTYARTKNYNLAEKYITESIQRALIMRDRYLLASGYATLGMLYKDKGDKTLAIPYLTRAYNIYKAIGVKSHIEKVKNALLELGVNPDKP